MFRKISYTFGSKALNAILGFANTIIITQNIGTEGKGVVTMFMSNLGLSLLISHIIGGNSIVYLSARYDKFKLLLPCYFWEIIMSFLTAFLLNKVGFCPKQYWLELAIVRSLFSLFKTHLFVLLGTENIVIHNILFPLPTLFQCIAGLFVFEYLNIQNLDIYIHTLYWVFGFCFLISLLFIIPKLKNYELPNTSSLHDLWKTGFKSHISNILYFLNNRIIFYVIGFYFAKSEVGIYSVAIALIEVILLIGQSVALMVYSKTVNMNSVKESHLLTTKLLKMSLIVTFFALLILNCIPINLYQFIFGTGFEKAKIIVLYLSPGTLMMSTNLVINSFWGGIGKYKYNNYSGLIGLIIMVVGSVVFVPNNNIETAAIVTSISFTIAAGYSYLLFGKYRMEKL